MYTYMYVDVREGERDGAHHAGAAEQVRDSLYIYV